MTTPRVTMPVRTTVRLIQRTKLPPKYPPCSAPAAMTEPYSPGDWQRFPCERRLIYADVVALNKFAVGRDNIAKVQANDISGHKRLSIDLLPFSITKHARFQRKGALQGIEGVGASCSSQNPNKALNNRSEAIIAKSPQSLTINAIKAAASIIQGIGP